GIDCFRGSEDDVISRVCGALRAFDVETHAEFMGDNSIPDAKVIDHVIDRFFELGDSVDYVNEHFLSVLYMFLAENRGMDAVSCDYLLVNDKEEVIARKNCLEEPIACGIMFRADQLIDIGLYDETFLLHEDRDLRYRFLQKHLIHRIELPMYRYRRHDSNITNDGAADELHSARLIEKHGEGAK
ncbi:MAG: hypothetical protein EBZ00_05010, partial [Actinobacteria bacterium]|nr:hypothetical protein [Actinomycetota bacterium]